MPPTFFARPADFRRWLEKHHRSEKELWVGLHKKGSGRPSITWPESIDEALCFGWIDGIRKSVDQDSYMIRFTPRKSTSVWSNVNIARAKELIRMGRMEKAGLEAFEKRDEKKSGIYSFERKNATLPPELESQFRAHRQAWKFFDAQPPGYRRLMAHFVISAKQAETRARRLRRLIEASAAGKRL
ncbi:MAG TPA: YdeI/OmpD-associated family protein [Thermoanaerobaculia bacterium]|nr:YdeI/OmpD-associated family protein [Thermoanaerobaculia bacterium]